jgi:hypothetical protein
LVRIIGHKLPGFGHFFGYKRTKKNKKEKEKQNNSFLFMDFSVDISYYPQSLKDTCLLAIARYHFEAKFTEEEEADYFDTIYQLPEVLRDEVFDFDKIYKFQQYLTSDFSYLLHKDKLSF